MFISPAVFSRAMTQRWDFFIIKTHLFILPFIVLLARLTLCSVQADLLESRDNFVCRLAEACRLIYQNAVSPREQTVNTEYNTHTHTHILSPAVWTLHHSGNMSLFCISLSLSLYIYLYMICIFLWKTLKLMRLKLWQWERGSLKISALKWSCWLLLISLI